MPQFTITNPLHSVDETVSTLLRPLQLVCKSCGAVGDYQLRTVFYHPDLYDAIFARKRVRSVPAEDFDAQMSFNGIFYCRACGADGPWHFPEPTTEFLKELIRDAVRNPSDEPKAFAVCLCALFDGTQFRTGAGAVRHLRQLLEKTSDSAFLWNRLGNICEKGGRTDDALSAFLKAIELEPNDAESILSVGNIYAERNDRDRAVPYYHRFLTIAPTGLFHNPKLKRPLMEMAVMDLVDWSVESKGTISIFPPPPKPDPSQLAASQAGSASDPPGKKEVTLLSFDPSTPEGFDRLVDFLLMAPAERAAGFKSGLFRSISSAKNAAAFSKTGVPGRNEKCPCGSGKKFKHCCARR